MVELGLYMVFLRWGVKISEVGRGELCEVLFLFRFGYF